MSNFFNNFINGFAFGMLANNPFFGGCCGFGFGMYPMFGRVDFGGFANPFPSVFGNMGYSSMTAQIPPSTFANAGFPAVDFRGVCQTIWDTYADPDSDYNKQMREAYKQMEEQAKKRTDSSGKRQYIPQIEFPFSSFYMPSSVAMNPWVTGFPWSDTPAKQKNEKPEEKIEKKSTSENINLSSNAKELKNKWTKKQPQLTDEFYAKVINISKNVKCSPDDLMAVMNLETNRTFSTSVKNPGSTATGLIQFTEASAKDLDTTTSNLAKMTPEQQLDYVEKYLLNWKKKNNFSNNDTLTAGTLYAMVFQPANAKKEVLAYKGTEEYSKNKMLDVNKDGKITKDDLSEKLKEFIA